MKETTCFDNGILTYCAKNKLLKPIALFYLIKAKYNHSIIYDYTPSKLARLIKLHPKTVERYVKKLEDHKFVEHRNGHLLFIGRYKLDTSKGYKHLETRPFTSFNGILTRIYFLILINNKAQQTYRIATNYGIKLGVMNPRIRKKAIKHADLRSRGLESSQTAIMSVTGASRLFNTSRTKAHTVLKDLKDKNYLKFRPIINEIGKARPLKYLQGYLGYFYNSFGMCYQYLGREITVGRYIG